MPTTRLRSRDKKTFAQIELTLSQANATRASFEQGVVGLATENYISDVRLYMFNSVGVLEAVEDFDPNQTLRTFQATTGSKSFVALVNMGANLPAHTLNSTSLTNFLEQVEAIADLSDIAADNAFWMSNSTPVAATLAEWDGTTGTVPTANDVRISVARMVAKIGVEFAPSTQIGGGKLEPSTVEYKINNNPASTRLFSKRDAAGFLVTPFYDQTYASGNYWPEVDADYKTTSVGTITTGEFDATSVGYMLENSNIDPVGGNATYAVIRGQWVPDELLDQDGLYPLNTNPSINNGTFWRIKNAAGDYYPEFYYELPVSVLVSGDTPVEYTNGIAYYALYINDTEKSLAAEDKYVIERNTQWAVTITSVSGCGDSSEGELPGIVDPTDPLDVDSYIQASISVVDWVERGQLGGI